MAVQNDLDMTYTCVPRSSGEAVGGVSTDSVSSIAHLTHPDPEKQDMTCSLDAHTLQKLVQVKDLVEQHQPCSAIPLLRDINENLSSV